MRDLKEKGLMPWSIKSGRKIVGPRVILIDGKIEKLKKEILGKLDTVDKNCELFGLTTVMRQDKKS